MNQLTNQTTKSEQPEQTMQTTQAADWVAINSQVASINKLLAPGITASINLRGEIRYAVRVSKSGIGGQSFKQTLGTFADYGSAVRALIEFKITGHLNTFPHEQVNKLLQTFAQVTQEKQQAGLTAIAQVSQQLSPTSVALRNTADSIQEIKQEQTDAFAILNASDFMLIRAGHPFHYTADNGESRTIPAAVVDAWFKQFS